MKLSVLVALALATGAAYAAEAPLYVFSKATFSQYQSSPIIPTEAKPLSYSSISGLLAHATGTTKDRSLLGFEVGYLNQFILTPSTGNEKAVAAISVLGVDSEVGKQIFPYSPTFMVENVPTSAQALKDTMSQLAATGFGLQVKHRQQEFGAGSLDLVVDSEIEPKLPSPGLASEVVKSFRERFASFQADIFDIEVEADAAFIVEVEYIAKLFEAIADLRGKSSLKSSEFAGVVMGGLQEIATQHKRNSEQYIAACSIVKELMENIVVPKYLNAFDEGATVALLFAPPVSHHLKRAVTSTTPLGLGSSEQCAAKDSAGCTTITNNCNGRGSCVQKKTGCWVCKCNVVPDSAFKGNTAPSHWSGNACQYKDTVAEFHLFWGTGIALMIVVFATTMFLISMGGPMDSGPMVAMSGGVPGIKVD